MATDEAIRYSLHRRLDELVGPDEAALLMSGVPPFPWAEVATKRDLQTLESRLLGRIDAVRGELLDKIGAFEGKIGALEAKIGALEAKIGSVRGELLDKIGALDGKIGAQTWKMYGASFVSSLTTAGLVLAVVRLA